MSFKDLLHKETGISRDRLPSSYQVIGDVLLIKLLRVKSGKEGKIIASAVMKIFPQIKTVCEIKGVESEYRIPKMIKLAGNGLETIHKEHGIMYELNVEKIMFSKGNLFERQRLLDQIKNGETVVDMFAGIGYFSLGVAKKAKKVYAIEKNPAAFSYLKKNIRLNKINNIVAINADCRKVQIDGKADRVLLGYFPGTEKFLTHALSLIEKGVIHYHNVYREDELWQKPIKDIESAMGERKYKILYKKKVKSTAPRTYHVVIDIEVL